ncbi:DUF3560 domain-containing protein [Nocardia africana]|uniref:Domain of uncharacterized function (DUF3560) n=1 Tax=Nocardia africana TaxID=134964 RepID=A0A379X4S0_9NOCA|nr:DUF3560 domain-containing protein [Nocardia africana]MCC3318461.1 DUF3560 domain-containing protein [Nocardia africana]SUH71960.1 Domain of uncharacterised function (DUF3560) [Nocardia africana]
MVELTITHTAAEGTRIEGTSRGDGTYETMGTVERRIGRRYWIWAHGLDCWVVRNSRDRQPNMMAINGAAEALREAGHEVAIRIDRRHRAAAEAAADQADRRHARAGALRDKADRHQRRAEAADAAADRAQQSLPPGGEPIKIGHHSQCRHERAHARAEQTARKARQARADAAEAERRARAAEHAATVPDNPATIRRRIERLEAAQRADERARDGYTRNLGVNAQTGQTITEVHRPATGAYREQLDAAIAQRADELAHQREQLDAARAAGAVVITASMIRPGDRVHTGRTVRPEPVVKVNKTTVTLDVEPGWNNKLPINKITGITNSTGQRVSFDAEGRRSDEPAAALQ